MVRRKAIGARRNPFADPDEWMDEDFELLRERAKIYMARREWDRALLNLNRTLYHWGAKFPEKYDYDDPPNKQVLTYLLLNLSYNFRKLLKKSHFRPLCRMRRSILAIFAAKIQLLYNK